MKGFVFAVALATASMSVAAIAPPCGTMAGNRYPEVRPLAELLSVAKQVRPVKDQFETTAAYEAQVAAAARALGPSPVVVEWPITNPAISPPDPWFSYDADKQEVTIDGWGPIDCLKYGTMLQDEGLKALPLGNAKNDALIETYCLQRSVTSTPGSPYVAENAFGAPAVVTPVTDQSVGIIIGMADVSYDVWNGEGHRFDSHREPLFRFHLEASPARSLRDNAVALLELTPVPPYYATGIGGHSPTLASPVSLSNHVDFLVAKLTCVGIADPNLKVLYQVRPVPLVASTGR